MTDDYGFLSCVLLASLEVGKSAKQMHILNLYDTPEQMWMDFDCKKAEMVKMVGENGYSRIKYSLSKNYVYSILDDLERDSICVVTFFDQDYPDSLHNIFDPPLALFYRGEVSLLSSPCFAVVGTRKASPYGKKVTENFTKELCERYTIVSGLAYGIDTVAHQTTIDNNGKTIAVLGSGLNNVYPASNKGLAEEIIKKGGLVISEHCSYTEPVAYNFPMRNRIIAGLAQGVLVTEAPSKSGTISTIEYALDYGRDIYVVPGDIYNQNYKGSNDLIKHMQGCLVTSPSDILISETYLKTPRINKIQLDVFEQIVVDLLSVGAKHFDDIVKESKIDASQLNYTLSCLELKGLITRHAGNIYQYTATEEYQ